MTLHAPIFLSHGAPSLAIEDVPARHFLQQLGRELPHPRAALVVSAHWETAEPTVNAVAANRTIHDFRGFAPELHAMHYRAPGSPLVAGEVAHLLHRAGFEAHIDEERGLDHGAWVPLSLIWPDAHIPVLQLSVQPGRSPDHHYRVGRAIEPLTHEDVLVIGSGSFTHDLSSLAPGQPEPDWVKGFADWMDEAITHHRTDDLLHYRSRAPFAQENHPTDEHLLPLFVALGAAGPRARAERIHSSVDYGVLRMDAYRFEPREG